MCGELPPDPPGRLEEVVDEGKARRPEGRRWPACARLRVNPQQVCGAEWGGKCVYLGSRVVEEIRGGIHPWEETGERGVWGGGGG